MKHIIINLLNTKILLVIVLLTVVGCRKDPKIELVEEVDNPCGFKCEEFAKSSSWFGYRFYSTGPQYLTPKFNPADDQEFIYVRRNELGTSTELVKVNLIDLSETVLLSDLFVLSEPIWNESGWIVFSARGNKIWKIKDDGTNLTQLTFGAWDSFPYFNFNGSIIYYARTIMHTNAALEANPELYKDSKVIGINIHGEPVDSILAPDIRNKPDQPFAYQKWDQAYFTEEQVYFFWALDGKFGIYVLDLISNEISPVDQWDKGIKSYQLVNNVKYHDGFVYLSKFRNDLLRINVNTGENERIQCGCDGNYYNTLSVSPSGDKMLVERIITTSIDVDEFDEQHEIWMMDLDGSNTVKILGDSE